MNSSWRKKVRLFWIYYKQFILVGVYGAQKLSTSAPTHNQDEAKRKEHAKEFYGSAAEKIMQLENQMNLKFEQIHVEKNATLWPSIPLRF